jgi:hypothetical protein
MSLLALRDVSITSSDLSSSLPFCCEACGLVEIPRPQSAGTLLGYSEGTFRLAAPVSSGIHWCGWSVFAEI